MNYTITFEDGIIYTSPDIRGNDPEWASEDGEKLVGIREVKIDLPNGQTLILTGFERYNFFIEATQAFGQHNKGAVIVSFSFCGAYLGHIVRWEINYMTRQIVKRVTKDGEEYNGTASKGWRVGLMGENARSGLCPS